MMREHNDEEFDDEQYKLEHKSDEKGNEEDYDLKNDFVPKDEKTRTYIDFKMEFEPRDENEHQSFNQSNQQHGKQILNKNVIKRKTHHPKLRENYFKAIDTKETAYWLGFLYADGCIDIDKRNVGSRRLTIRIDKKDEILIDRFARAIGFNLSYKKYEKDSKIVRLQIGNKHLIKDLISHGVIPRKSKKIELPNLLNIELDLAFLLGFFDGDGTQRTSKITSGSKLFCEQLKTKYNINNKIHPKFGKGKGYDLHLGAELFNEMLDNYKFSLERKRQRFSTKDERIRNIRKNVWKGGHKRKLILNKEELRNLVWTMLKTEIAKNHNVSDRTIGKWSKIWSINTPPRGYWSKKGIKKSDE